MQDAAPDRGLNGEPTDQWVLYQGSRIPSLDWCAGCSTGSRRLKLLTPLSLFVGLLLVLCLLARCWLMWASMTHCGVGPPSEGLMIVAKEDNAEIAFFRKKTVADVIDPALSELSRIQTLLQAAERGMASPEHSHIRLKAIATRLSDLTEVAMLRQIPRRYASRYEVVLHSIAVASQARVALERGLESENLQQRERYLQHARELSSTAEGRLEVLRAGFAVRNRR